MAELRDRLDRMRRSIEAAPPQSRDAALQAQDDEVAEEERRRKEIATKNRMDSEQQKQRHKEALQRQDRESAEELRRRNANARNLQRENAIYLDRAAAHLARLNVDDASQRRMKDRVDSDPGRFSACPTHKFIASEARRVDNEFKFAVLNSSEPIRDYTADQTGHWTLHEFSTFEQRYQNLPKIRELLRLEHTQADQRHFEVLASQRSFERVMPSREVPNGAIGEECPICLQELVRADIVAVMPCRHYCFHHACIRRWLAEGNDTCPLCRQSVTDSLNAFAR